MICFADSLQQSPTFLVPCGQWAKTQRLTEEESPTQRDLASSSPPGTRSETALLEFQGDLPGDVRAVVGLAVGWTGTGRVIT